MVHILEKLNLSDHAQRFIEEHITPDIVWMLSLFEINQSGVRNHSEIMALRIECTKYGGGQPKRSTAHAKYEIPKDMSESLPDQGTPI